MDSVPNVHGHVGKNMARSPEVADAVPVVWVPSAWPARGRGAAHIKNHSKSGYVSPPKKMIPLKRVHSALNVSMVLNVFKCIMGVLLPILVERWSAESARGRGAGS